MGAYIIRRIAQAFVVIVGVSVAVFFLIRLTGDPTDQMLAQGVSPENIASIRREMGLDLPIYLQYKQFIINALHGDFGTSISHKQPVIKLVVERLPATFQLTIVALLWAALIGIPAGVISAVRRHSPIDSITRSLAFVGQCMPVFWLGLLLILIFGVKLQLLPIYGSGTFRHLIMPAVTLGTYSVATITRLSRSSLLDVLGEDYIRTAKAKGLSKYAVLTGHALRNSLIPTITIVGLQFGTTLAGAVVTETVFSWPGLGRLVIQAVQARDYTLIQGALIIIAFMMVMVNLLIDITCALVDPRIRY